MSRYRRFADKDGIHRFWNLDAGDTQYPVPVDSEAGKYVQRYINDPNVSHTLVEDLTVSPEQLVDLRNELEFNQLVANEEIGKIKQNLLNNTYEDKSDPVDRALTRYAGDYIEESGFNELMARAQSAVAAEDAGYLKLDEKGFEKYGEKEALAEQLGRQKAADIERYGGELPYLVTKSDMYTPAEQKRNRALLEGKVNKTIPYDSIRGEAVRKKEGRLGIQGDFKPDSEVRVHTRFANAVDPLTGTPMIEHMPVMTEFMSTPQVKSLYNEWKNRNQEINRSGRSSFRMDTDIGSFNRFLAEYYGQQGLKLAGRTAVPDNKRSQAAIRADKRGLASSVGTDRLLEMTPTFLDEEVSFQKDYRYLDNDGNIVVGDSQTLPARDGSNAYGIEILNATRMDPRAAQNFERNLANEISRLREINPESTIEDALINISRAGQMPAFADRIPQDRTERFAKVGKGLSGQDKLGHGGLNPREFMHQQGAQEILYSTLPADFEKRIGARPQAMTLVDLDKVNTVLGDPSVANELTIKHYRNDGRSQKGKVRINVPQDILLGEGAAYPLLSNSLMKQLR